MDSIPLTPALAHLLAAVVASKEVRPGSRLVRLSEEEVAEARALHQRAEEAMPPFRVASGKVVCPHCGYYQGKRLSRAQAKKAGRGRFVLVEDTTLTNDVEGVEGSSLLIEPMSETDYDGENERVECPLCHGLSRLPDDFTITSDGL